jgi:hypothetical protein
MVQRSDCRRAALLCFQSRSWTGSGRCLRKWMQGERSMTIDSRRQDVWNIQSRHGAVVSSKVPICFTGRPPNTSVNPGITSDRFSHLLVAQNTNADRTFREYRLNFKAPSHCLDVAPQCAQIHVGALATGYWSAPLLTLPNNVVCQIAVAGTGANTLGALTGLSTTGVAVQEIAVSASAAGGGAIYYVAQWSKS